MATESDFQKRVIKKLRSHGCYAYKNASSVYTEKGRPDLTVCVPATVKHLKKLFENVDENTVIGLFAGLELKREDKKGELSEAQRIVGRQILNSGGIWMVIDDMLNLDRFIDTWID